ncbi:MAG: nicotinate-nucleotide adenylyltransferase [Desulfobulbaceae bacterium]|uniref:Nicotinate-nucleotide adenylyltransferase n=1 Tax=Candidatus Desulfobia pelagia TaxID=2841692 RepID=A0A8J6TFP1_9BACT|nr:nicotinate-nucleotide adenylyltransferase [Candidatus Desulfobia pelagia]
MVKTGFIHGRFQVLHNDHLTYLLAGKKECEFLVVGITNPDPSLTKQDASDVSRSDDAENPLTYFERFLMVQAALVEAGLTLEEFMIVPFPVNFPELYRYYIPEDASFFLTIYDEWGERKLAMFEAFGLRTHILWRRLQDQKGLTSTDIRQRIAEGKQWQHMVPPAVARLIVEWRLAERLRQNKR